MQSRKKRWFIISIKKDSLAVIVPILLIIALSAAIVNIDSIFPTPAAAEKLKGIARLSNLSMDGIESFGTSPGAKIEASLFSDFNCPACAMFSGQFRALMEYYGSRVNFEFRHFIVHPSSVKIAEASECARDQGKFWEYHDLIFENQGSHNEMSLAAIAASLEMNVEQFGDCLVSGEKNSKVKADSMLGQQAGIRGTPTVLINGVLYEGARAFDELKEIISKELENG